MLIYEPPAHGALCCITILAVALPSPASRQAARAINKL